MKRFLLIHYSEIGLKRGNKGYFVDKLRKHIKESLEKRFKQTFVIKVTLGRLMIELDGDFVESEYLDVLQKIGGIQNIQFVFEGSAEIDELGKQIWENMASELLEQAETFCVRLKRSQKAPYKSVEAERDLGAILLRNEINKKVKLKNPDLEVNVEVFNEHGYFSYQKHAGAGGLSHGSGGKLVALMSAGFDSPVAAYRMMRRGARVIFVHFHGYPYTDQEEMEHVKDLVKILSEYQLYTKLYLLPFGKIQRAIATNLDIPGKLRVVMYRRMMIRIAEQIAKKEKAKGLITGDSYGQVASQTPQNIFAIHEVSTIPLFQPLISFDKEEIIRIAESIGTAEISKLPCKDTCSMFSPKHPELKASPYDLREIEEKLPIDEYIAMALENPEILAY